ncbi:MAG: IS5 family transposase, partial [Aquificaceae bacterium]|nr:IS5 family transposase [Aquificaceae bacterium]
TNVPNFRTIHYRHTREDFHFDHLPDNLKDLPQDFVIVLDSTGIKLTNRGEWLNKKHGKKRRKGWIKVHVALDISSGKVLDMKVTDNRTHDSQCAVELVENSVKKVESLGGNVKEVIGDTGVDSHEIFRHLASRGIKPVIKVRRDAVITGNKARDDVVREIRKGRKRWKEKNEYGRRWRVESFFSSFKRWFGEYVSSVKFENIRKELMFKVMITNMFLSGSIGMIVR